MENNEFDEKSGQIRKLASMAPEQLVDHLSTLHKDMNGAAPNILPHVHSTAINAIQFLNSKIPQGSGGLVQDVPRGTSKSDQERWLSLHDVVNNPLSVMGHIEKNSLTPSHVEALKTVYPGLHQEMVQKMSERLGVMKMNKEEMPYKKRVQLGLFMGEPLDSTMTQPVMQTILMANAPKGKPQQVAGAQKKPSQATANSMQKLDKMYQTPGQARAASRSKD